MFVARSLFGLSWGESSLGCLYPHGNLSSTPRVYVFVVLKAEEPRVTVQLPRVIGSCHTRAYIFHGSSECCWGWDTSVGGRSRVLTHGLIYSTDSLSV